MSFNLNHQTVSPSPLDKQLIYLLFSLFLLSSMILAINHAYFNYTANNYLPIEFAPSATVLFLLYIGVKLLTGTQSQLSRATSKLCFFFILIASIAYLTNAVQLTPFPVIDDTLVLIDKRYLLSTTTLMASLQSFTALKAVLQFCYMQLDIELIVIPLVLIIFEQSLLFKQHCFLLLSTALIGFSIYYFLPTTAPATHLDSPFFLIEQYATGIKFQQIHQAITPTTMHGGLIAFPSFHVIWALICQFSLRRWKTLFYILLPQTWLLIAACPLLGWHYVIDILAGLVIFLVALLWLSQISSPLTNK